MSVLCGEGVLCVMKVCSVCGKGVFFNNLFFDQLLYPF